MQGTDRAFAAPGPLGRALIGADSRCDIVLRAPGVSPIHCALERSARGPLRVCDRDSDTGVYINGNRVEVAELAPGALLAVGDAVLVAVGHRDTRHRTAFERLCGDDPGFRDAVSLALRAARSPCSVLIVGETGTGKELVARAIHEASPRAAGPFVALNCGAIAANLIGSELFGHEKGAFTGAIGDREGAFATADGGTLFLDELGELPLALQPHLLRALETGAIRRVGGDRDVRVDARVVAATNRLEGLGTGHSRLRLDLYHRIATVVVTLPPLRARPDDIPVLVRAFMDELAQTQGSRTISRTTLRALRTYPWPGNVRELRRAVERAVALCPRELTLDTLLPAMASDAPSTSLAPTAPATPLAPLAPRDPPKRTLRRRLATGAREPTPPFETDDARPLSPVDEILRDAMLDALDRHHSIRAAAKALGMPKSTFADRARRYGIR